jgi:DNA invertase Pin-like site-specific DNA recombinase
MTQSRTTPIPSVAYYRKSTDRQEASIPRQRESVEAFAKANGYEILREYVDEGISGDATEKRTDFLRMRDDATRGEFRVILCWDKDRFGRFDSIEQGYWVKPLRDAGVRLITVTQGLIDWNSFGGRIVDAALAESKHEFLRSLGQNTTAGKIRNAKLAYFNGGSVPYGFGRLLLDDKDMPIRRLRRGEKTDKPRDWHTILVPTDDPVELETIRWLFQSFADRTVSCRTLANELNAKGIPGPGSAERRRPTPWGRQTVVAILENPNYVGQSVYGRTNRGKFCRVVNGEAQPVSGIPKTKLGNPRKHVNTAGIITQAEAHDGVIQQELWDRVQAKLAVQRRLKQYPRGTGYPLAGLVRCGHCGKKMHGCTHHCKNRKGRKAYRRYVCSSYNLNGPSCCGFHAIREEILLPYLVERVREEYLGPDNLEQLEQELTRQAQASQQVDPRKVQEWRTRLEQLDGDIRQGTQNLLRAGSNVDLLSAALSELREERKRLARDLDGLERALGNKPADVRREILAAIDSLRELRESLHTEDMELLREVLLRLVVRIDLYYEAIPKRKNVYHRLIRGSIRLRHPNQVAGIRDCQASCPTPTSITSTVFPSCSNASQWAR